jgi:hypothetical protein
MATIPREMFPNLPPELRNEVYNYLSTPETTTSASITGIPLKIKTFECKHTIVQLCPAHHGSNGLLALESWQFQEAREYSSWLLNNATELNIGVVFRGRINNFVQQDWDKKMEAHLRKIAKLHPWLKKVAKYNIQILWSPVDGVLKSRKNKRTAGRIVRDIATTLTALVHGDVKKKRGELNLKLCPDHKIAVETVLSGTRFGFSHYFSLSGSGLDDFKKQTREVWKEAHAKQEEQKSGSILVPVPQAKPEERSVMEVANSAMKWTTGAKGHLVMRKCLLDGGVTELITGSEQGQGTMVDHVLVSLVGECLGHM